MTTRILIVDDELEMGNFFKFFLEAKGYEVLIAVNGHQARAAFKEHFHLVLLDLKLPDVDGLTLLREIKKQHPKSEVLIMTGYSTVKSAVEAIQLGAFDYLEKPFDDLDMLEKVIDQALSSSLAMGGSADESVFQQQKIFESLGYVLGPSDKMHRLLMIAERLAMKNITLLIRGETGTGKEVLARYIHRVSTRCEQPFLAINCGALPNNLLESELFGHEKGAFTGAAERHKGIFELAHKGMLFLYEIGEASQEIQVKLLRVLETGEILRVGGEKPVRTDTRVISATNAPLEQMVKEKRFREDLFYRLDVVTLSIPPLRERREDIYPLAIYFLKKNYPDGHVPQLSTEAIEALYSYFWPGNIRELANAMAQVAAICDVHTVLEEHLPEKITDRQTGVNEEIAHDEINTYPLEQKWLDELSGHLEAIAEQVDLTGGFDLQFFLDGLNKATARATRHIINRVLKDTGNRYPQAALCLRTSPRVLRYLNKEKNC